MNTYRVFAVTVLSLSAAIGSPAVGQTVSYTDDVHPILAERCYKCHSGDERKGGFSMDSRESILKGGEFGPAVALGDSEKSLLVELITSDDSEEWMPPKGDRLTSEQVAVLRAWIDAELPWDAPTETGWQAPLHHRDVKVPRGRGIHGSKNPIDRLLEDYFERHDAKAPQPVDDYRFARRAYMDLIGMLPTSDAVDAFVADRNRDKREQLVDALLADRRSYAEHWMTFWNDALRNDFQGTGYIDGGRKQITGWLYKSLYDNNPYNQFVTELIAPNRESEGFINGIKWRGATTANQEIPLQAARSVSQVFLGVNLKCASCHDSFVNEWKLADAYGLANVFSDTPMELVRCDVPTGRMAETRFLWPELGTVDANAPREERQQQVAALVTAPENGRFARTLVNRIWASLMGRGLVAPADSMDAEPWDVDVLDWLAQDFADNGYDLEALIRLIATSKAYQLESDSRPPVEKDYRFAGPVPRRLSAEQFYDAMACITGVWHAEPKYEPKPYEGSASAETIRAWRVPADELMRALGRPNREQVVLARDSAYTRLLALELTNGDTLDGFLNRGAAHMLANGPVDTEQLFVHALGRKPEAAEKAVLQEYGATLNQPEDLADLLWLLFSHPEFQLVF